MSNCFIVHWHKSIAKIAGTFELTHRILCTKEPHTHQFLNLGTSPMSPLVLKHSVAWYRARDERKGIIKEWSEPPLVSLLWYKNYDNSHWLTCLPYMRISCTVVNVSVAPKHPPNTPAKNSMMTKIWLSGMAMMQIALRPRAIVTRTLGLNLLKML